jgi:iron complex transport system ATP-binding protein
MLESVRLSYEIDGRRLVDGLNLTARPGDFVVLAGPNGAGKTTALRMLCGELAPTSGSVRLNGRPISSLSARELALERACFEQNPAAAFPFTVEETAYMGRQPHAKGFRQAAEDHAAVQQALKTAGVRNMADRLLPTLSGGEATRTHFARVLAQEPRLLLLDEPTNHLDIRHRQSVLAACKALTKEGRAVAAVLHDLNLAAFFATELVVLQEGATAAQGPPEEVLTPELIENVYGVTCEVWRHPSGCPWVVPTIETSRANSNGRKKRKLQENLS